MGSRKGSLIPPAYETSEEIFSSTLTLPQIRSLHKSLHAQIEEKSSRLRTQVGGSYRELLDTADAIIQMRRDNDRVQHVLERMGGCCGRAVVTGKVSSLQKFVAAQDNSEAAAAIRLRLLEACTLVSERILKGGSGLGDGKGKGDQLVIVAKILALSRLIVKSFSMSSAASSDVRSSLEASKRTLESFRRRLRRRVEKLVERPGDDSQRPQLLQALCVPSLTLSSGAKDALRFFLATRKNAMARVFDVQQDGERLRKRDNVMHALRLYTRTLLDVQDFLPAKLPRALSSLTKRPLVQDETLRRIENLRLDIYERWCSEEFKYFTPFIRHDDLDGEQARDMLSSWAEDGSQCFLNGLNQTLNTMTDYKHITELRTKLLQLWIRDGGKIKGLDAQEMLDNLRQAINNRMLAVLESKVSKLRLVGSEVAATLKDWQDGVNNKHTELWDQKGYEEALAIGVAPFLQEIASRLYGRNECVSKAMHCCTSWCKVIDSIKDMVNALKKQRWDNDFEELEDEDTIEARQRALGEQDPKQLQDKLDAALDRAYRELETHLTQLWDEEKDKPGCHGSSVAPFFLRILRDIRSKLPDGPAVKDFGQVMVPGLHGKVAEGVADAAVQEFAATGLSARAVTGKLLWEGEPPVPNQPSSELFGLLHSLSTTMSGLGVDLWTAGAIRALKQRLGENLYTAWTRELRDLTASGPTTGGGDENPDKTKDGKNPRKKIRGEERKEKAEKAREKERMSESEEPSTERTAEEQTEEEEAEEEEEDRNKKLDQQLVQHLCTQWLFDIAVLQNCVGSESSAGQKLADVADQVYEHTGIEDETVRKRVVKLSGEFWQRISLLFGLLA